MESAAANDAPPPDPAPGLPPVQPPSGRFIARLFVIPGLIILVVVLVYIGTQLFVKSEHEPAYFLRQLDSDNPDIRWRGAHDLAQILKRPESATLRWKADARFALDLAERLELAFQNLKQEELTIAAEIAKSTDKDKQLLWRKLRAQRDHVSFLASALGEFHVPVGAPVLCAILKYDGSPDLNGNTLQRRKALWSLTNMGVNLKGFADIPADKRQDALAVLKAEASASQAERARWARTALCYLDKSALPGSNAADVVKVDETLRVCADAEDRFLRQLVAMSLSFWDGETAEATLLKLTQDNGHGTLIRVEEND